MPRALAKTMASPTMAINSQNRLIRSAPMTGHLPSVSARLAPLVGADTMPSMCSLRKCLMGLIMQGDCTSSITAASLAISPSVASDSTRCTITR